VISLTFQELSLEPHERCSYDKVSIFDAASLTVLGEYCKLATTSSIISTTASVDVIFKSDDTINDGRFSLTWKFVPQDIDCTY